MLVGATLSKYVTPETCDYRGRSRRLEDLGKGKAYRKQLERNERGDEESRVKEQ